MSSNLILKTYTDTCSRCSWPQRPRSAWLVYYSCEWEWRGFFTRSLFTTTTLQKQGVDTWMTHRYTRSSIHSARDQAVGNPSHLSDRGWHVVTENIQVTEKRRARTEENFLTCTYVRFLNHLLNSWRWSLGRYWYFTIIFKHQYMHQLFNTIVSCSKHAQSNPWDILDVMSPSTHTQPANVPTDAEPKDSS